MALIRGYSGVVSVTESSTTTAYTLAGEFEISIENDTQEKGPYIGDANKVVLAAGRTYSFKVSGDLGARTDVAANDTWFDLVLSGYTGTGSPDTLTLATTGGKSFAFAAASTTYTKFTYTHNAEDGVSFEAEGFGTPTITNTA
jgi:hypothetical protein